MAAGNGTIGALLVSLGIDTAAFEDGVKNTESTVSKSFGMMNAVVGGFVAGLAAGLVAEAGNALKTFATSAMDTANELTKFAQLSNSNTDEFQRWAAGARTVGIEQDKLSDILKDVNDRVGDFVTTGGGPMKDFFEQVAPKVGITAKAFQGLSGPQALQLYVSSMQKANLTQQEMTFFMEAMASDSTALLPLLLNSGNAMTTYGDKAAAAGQTMSQELIGKLNEAKITFTQLQVTTAAWAENLTGQGVVAAAAFTEQLISVGNSVSQFLMPSFTALSDALTEFANNGILAALSDGLGNIATVAGGALVGAIVLAVDALTGIVEAINGVVTWFQTLDGDMQTAILTATAAIAAWVLLPPVIGAIGTAIAGAAAFITGSFIPAFVAAVTAAAPFILAGAAIAAAVYGFLKFKQPIMAFGQAISNWIGKVASTAMNVLRNTIGPLVSRFDWMWQKVQPIIESVAGVVGWMAEKLGIAFKTVKVNVEKAVTETKSKVSDLVGNMNTNFAKIPPNTTANMGKHNKALKKGTDKSAQIAKQHAEEMKRRRDEIQRALDSVIDSLRTPMEKETEAYATSVKALDDALAEKLISYEKYTSEKAKLDAKHIQSIKDEVHNLLGSDNLKVLQIDSGAIKDSLEAASEGLVQDWAKKVDETKDLRRAFSETFSDGLRAAVNGDWSDFLKQKLNNVMMNLFDKLGNQLFDILSKVNFGTDSKGTGSSFGGIIKTVASIFGSSPGFASGGTVGFNGGGGVDSKLFSAWVSPDEIVSIGHPKDFSNDNGMGNMQIVSPVYIGNEKIDEHIANISMQTGAVTTMAGVSASESNKRRKQMFSRRGR